MKISNSLMYKTSIFLRLFPIPVPIFNFLSLVITARETSTNKSFQMLQSIHFLSLIAASAASCNHMCGKTTVQYPFGFSPSCHIQLSCNSTSGISFSGFPIQNFTTNHTFSVNISVDCNRSVDTASAFFSTNYALTHKSGLFLRNCNQSVTQPCLLPTLVVSQMSHQVQNCRRKDDNLTCFFNNTGNMYLTKGMVSKTSCRDLFTSVLYEPNLEGQMALVFGLVEIGWWMTGEHQCVANATRTPVGSEVKDGYWCKCNNGFIGDGFADGEGCHRGKYLLKMITMQILTRIIQNSSITSSQKKKKKFV